MTSPKRDLLIDTALRLFGRHGFHAVGVDRVIEEAGVARMTLYNHFKSKDELILAVLRRRDERFRNWFMRRVERAAPDPRGRPLAVFDALDEWVRGDDFTGCMFVAAAAEYGGDDPIHRAAGEHKDLMLAYLRDLCAKAGAKNPAGLADGLNLLAEGAVAMAHVAGHRDAARTAKAAAEVLLRDAGLQG
ncbi:MAG: TetR family transcriptional regulator [Rhodospirillales bacterium CG15_BIG_FIL_POST_REV_8_21_14_020_66_15]|nr:MAG: TetR family transcriptional regulator [Rhodospirillales bacterium CG15_BIG_FIL_POST_REV_8_21_14_020_66_15]